MSSRRNFRAVRESKLLTTREVSIETNVTERTILNAENGKNISTETLEKLADHYGVSTDYLLGREPIKT